MERIPSQSFGASLPHDALTSDLWSPEWKQYVSVFSYPACGNWVQPPWKRTLRLAVRFSFQESPDRALSCPLPTPVLFCM